MNESSILKIIFLCLTLGCLITSLIFSFLKHGKRNSIDIFNAFQTDINNKPIFSISKAPCEGNEKSSLIIDKFPGTVSGCDCLGKKSSRIPNNHRNRVTRSSCSRNETRAGCEDIVPIEKRNLYPVISSMGVYDSAGNYYGSDSDIDQNKDLITYRNMIYYVLKDPK